MRILFDARSVRTPAGLQVFQGLTDGWLKDPRVRAVYAALPDAFDRSLIPLGVRAIRVRSVPWPWHLLCEVPRVAREVHADVVFAPNGLPPPDRRGVAYFQDLHHFRRSTVSRPDPHLILQWTFRRAWWAYALRSWRLGVPVSETIKHEVSRRLSIRVHTIPLGVEVGPLRWTGHQSSVFVMGGTGSHKAEADAISAWSMVSGGARRKAALIVGGVEPAPRREELVTLARRLGLRDQVTVLGGVKRPCYLGHIAAARFAVCCSTLEAGALAVAEALVIGAPVVCSDIPSHKELLARADAGASFPHGDVAALAAAMERALGGDLPRRLPGVPRGWSWDARATDHIDWYEQHI